MAEKSAQIPFMDMFQKFGENLKLPGPEISDIVDYHRKNLQALQDVAQTSSAGAQAAMQKQREALEEALAEIAEMAKNASSPDQMLTGQAEAARKVFETTLRNATEIGEIMRDSGSESMEILKKRVEESLEELRNAAGPRG